MQHPTLSLEQDAAFTRQVIDSLDGPVILDGHSYGGAVITEAGLHDKVAALVYVAAFAPDKGHRHPGPRQSLRLRVPARGRRLAHQAGRRLTTEASFLPRSGAHSRT